MSSSRIIRSSTLPARPSAWQVPVVGPARGSGIREDDGEDLAAVQERAWQAGFDQGQAAGREAATRAAASQAATFERVLDALAEPLARLDPDVEQELLALVTAVARHVVRRELLADPAHLLGVIREGLAALPSAERDIRVRLHPEDAAVIEEMLSSDGAPARWTIERDPLVGRGGCVIVSGDSQVDERLETRLGRVLATLFEDQRRG